MTRNLLRLQIIHSCSAVENVCGPIPTVMLWYVVKTANYSRLPCANVKIGKKEMCMVFAITESPSSCFMIQSNKQNCSKTRPLPHNKFTWLCLQMQIKAGKLTQYIEIVHPRTARRFENITPCDSMTRRYKKLPGIRRISIDKIDLLAYIPEPRTALIEIMLGSRIQFLRVLINRIQCGWLYCCWHIGFIPWNCVPMKWQWPH